MDDDTADWTGPEVHNEALRREYWLSKSYRKTR